MFSKTLKSGKSFNVFESSDVYRGRTFGEWTSDWWNWVVSEDPDYWQTGPVHFLSPGFARDDKQKTILFSRNMAGIMVAGTLVTKDEYVFPDQAILLPVLNTMVDSKTFPYLDSEEKMRREVRGDNDASPALKNDSFTIDDESIFDTTNKKNWSDLRVESPVFTLNVPDVPLGVSNKDKFDIPLVYPGKFDAVADGYWVFIQGSTLGTKFTIKWSSIGIHNYNTSANYQIEVKSR